MFKVLFLKEAIGGSLTYQAATEARLLAGLENKLNSLKVVKVHSVSFSKQDAEFGLIAIVEVEKAAKKAK